MKLSWVTMAPHTEHQLIIKFNNLLHNLNIKYKQQKNKTKHWFKPKHMHL